MNEPSVIQSQQTKWIEVILVCLGILIPLQTGPVIYQYLKWSDSTSDLVCNGLGALLILVMSVSLLLKNQPLSQCILKGSSSNSETSRRICELSGWLTIGIFTFGILFLVHTIPTLLLSLSDILSRWLTPRPGALETTERKAWFIFVIFLLNNIPQLTLALFLTITPQSLAKRVLSLQENWGSLKPETPQS